MSVLIFTLKQYCLSPGVTCAACHHPSFPFFHFLSPSYWLLSNINMNDELKNVCIWVTDRARVYMWRSINSDKQAHHVLKSRHDLCKDQLAVQIVKFPPGGDSWEQISTAAILHHQIHLPSGLDHLIQTHHIRVAQLLHAADLWRSRRLALLIQTHLVNNFDSYSLWDRWGVERESQEFKTK